MIIVQSAGHLEIVGHDDGEVSLVAAGACGGDENKPYDGGFRAQRRRRDWLIGQYRCTA